MGVSVLCSQISTCSQNKPVSTSLHRQNTLDLLIIDRCWALLVSGLSPLPLDIYMLSQG